MHQQGFEFTLFENGVWLTAIATLFGGDIATSNLNQQQSAQFRLSITFAGLTLTLVAVALVGWGIARTRLFTNNQETKSINEAVPK